MATRVAIPTKIYQAMIRAVDPKIPAKIRPLWEHPAGEIYNSTSFNYIQLTLNLCF